MTTTDTSVQASKARSFEVLFARIAVVLHAAKGYCITVPPLEQNPFLGTCIPLKAGGERAYERPIRFAVHKAWPLHVIPQHQLLGVRM